MIKQSDIKDLIVIEGSDGSGKKTQSEFLLHYINNNTKAIGKLWDFPDYKSETGKLITDMLRGKFGKDASKLNTWFTSPMYSLDRYQFVNKQNPDDYINKPIVVCNRYTMSNVIHQGARLKYTELRAYIRWLYDYEFDKLNLPVPSAVIFLYVPFEVSYENMMKRYGNDTSKLDINEQVDYLKLVDDNIMRIQSMDIGWHFINCIDPATGVMYDYVDINHKIRQALKHSTELSSSDIF